MICASTMETLGKRQTARRYVTSAAVQVHGGGDADYRRERRLREVCRVAISAPSIPPRHHCAAAAAAVPPATPCASVYKLACVCLSCSCLISSLSTAIAAGGRPLDAETRPLFQPPLWRHSCGEPALASTHPSNPAPL